ncbi:MAG: 4-alpha-glucanotransferase [Clostridiales bacterium]|nr:4-alpha-glucanotransferase [Clostridiales bacterium]
MRRSGVLLHITSLPSPGGIGTLGRAAYDFVDFMARAGLSVWQMLPIGPTGYGESPYQSASTHAGNPMLIDLPALVEEGLLGAELPELPGDPAAVDFDAVRREKEKLLRLSFEQSYGGVARELDAFAADHTALCAYAHYAAVKEHFGGAMWSKWPREYRDAERADEAPFRREIDFHLYCQWLFFRQWRALKECANKKGIALFGDMPIYVAEDSADTWAAPQFFQLDRDFRPVRVAGVPPDYFSADGQRWGSPLYRWGRMRRDKFRWWLNRLNSAAEMFDWLRIDHFIGFANYYSIPASSPTAREGRWEKAPGKALFKCVTRELPELTIIAEDLGEVGPRVKKLIARFGYPGMKVLLFGFDSGENNPHFPGNIVPNSVVYTGTHDNDTVFGWWEKAAEPVKALARKELPAIDDIADAMIECAFRSVADTAIVPMQDFLHLGGDARMNYPGTVGGNWRWRMPPAAATDALADKIRRLNDRTGRTISAMEGNR